VIANTFQQGKLNDPSDFTCFTFFSYRGDGKEIIKGVISGKTGFFLHDVLIRKKETKLQKQVIL